MALPGVGACDISKISKEANEVQGVEGVTGRLGSYWKVRECMIAEIKVKWPCNYSSCKMAVFNRYITLAVLNTTNTQASSKISLLHEQSLTGG